MNCKLTGLIVMCCLFAGSVSRMEAVIITKRVELGHPVVLPCSVPVNAAACEPEWKVHSTHKTVAKQTKGKVKEGEGFEGRIHLNTEDHSLTINSTVYNDQTSYECICAGKIVDVTLIVNAPKEQTAHVGDANATLPCYGKTVKQTPNDQIDMLWTKDDEPVLRVQAGNVTFGLGFDGRFKVSMDGYRRGDLSLTIGQVKTSDHGSYRCFFNRDEEAGYPTLINLRVEPAIEEDGGSPETTRSSGTTTAVTLTVIGIVSVLVAVLLVKWRRRRAPRHRGQRATCTALSAEETEPAGVALKSDDGAPAGRPAVDDGEDERPEPHVPVPESGTTTVCQDPLIYQSPVIVNAQSL